MRAADLYGDLVGEEPAGLRALVPGLAVATAGTLAAAFLADHYGAPLTLMALLIGLGLNFLRTDARLTGGLDCAAGPLMRFAIVLIGLRVTLVDIVALGPAALTAITCIVALTIAAGILTARLSGQDTAFGILAGGAVAICGASAAIGIAAILGRKRIGDEPLAMVLITVSTLSAGAMIAYPLVADLLALGDREAGFVMGAAIHDVAQVLGAALAISPEAGQIAAIVKLVRVSLLGPVLMGIAMALPSTTVTRTRPPWFVLGFVLMACLNSVAVIPPLVAVPLQHLSLAFLALAVTAVGIRSPLRQLAKVGWKSFLPILVPTLVCFVLAFLAANLVTP